ncbi:MAG: hypothetical protein RJB60_262, partial [Pseudomonadota bacterium]
LEASLIHAVPQMRSEDQWSAFVAPDLAPVFEDTPWLDIPPNEEGQADLLSRLQSILPRDFEQALQQLGVAMSSDPAKNVHDTGLHARMSSSIDTSSDLRAQAQQFLLQVMNNEQLPMAQRIEAAKALISTAS